MPSKKRKYNARFPAGRIKKIMQTDEEVGKVAQAVPIIISRTLELFVESLLSKALQVTTTRNAKTLSPSHVKQCILAEARFDFLRDLVKNIPDVSAAEEKELISGDISPISTRAEAAAALAQRFVPEGAISGCNVIRVPQVPADIGSSREHLKRGNSADAETSSNTVKTEPGTPITIEPAALMNIPPILGPSLTSTNEPKLKIDLTNTAIDLTKKEPKPVRTANFYQETLIADTVPHSSVIKINPIYTSPQPSTSYTSLSPVEQARKVEIAAKPTFERHNSLPRTPVTPLTPVINIDFSKNFAKPEIKVLDVTATLASAVTGIKNETKTKHVSSQNSRSKIDAKKLDVKPQTAPIDIDSFNSGNLQIDEDYDT